MHAMLSDLSVVAGSWVEEGLRYLYAIGLEATVVVGLMAGLALVLAIASAARLRPLAYPALLTWRLRPELRVVASASATSTPETPANLAA